jgi:hypothetical protein
MADCDDEQRTSAAQLAAPPHFPVPRLACPEMGRILAGPALAAANESLWNQDDTHEERVGIENVVKKV